MLITTLTWANRVRQSGSGGASAHTNGVNCIAGEIALGVDANGTVEGCYEPVEADITDLAHVHAPATALNLDNGVALTIDNANGDPVAVCDSPVGATTDADNYTILTSDHCKLLISTGGGTDIFTLPEADTAANIGQKYYFVKVISTGDLVVTPQTGDFLNGVVNATFTLVDDGDSATCVLTATTTIDWYCTGGKAMSAP